MKNDALIRIYTRPLFDLAVEDDKIEVIAAELQALSGLFQQVPQLAEYLDSPNVTREAKLDLLKKAFDQPWSEYFNGFINLVLRKGRQEILAFAWEVFDEYWDEYRGRIDVKVTSASKLSEDQKNALAAKLGTHTGKKVELHCVEDPDVIGGIRIQIGHQLLDATLAGKLAALKEELLQT